YTCFFSYLGTYASDRQMRLHELFIEPAERFPDRKFIIGGSMYPEGFPWKDNIWYLAHVPPPEHPAFYCSSLFTLNITRGTMAAMGYCPSGRLFEAAACGTPIISDSWEGIGTFFEPGREIIIVKTAGEVIKALQMPDEERMQIAEAARRRVLKEHTGGIRAIEFENILSRYVNGEKEKEKKICGE
ncbi:MAG: glycosyltransferase, partial [Syntrophothermus sp.]